MYNPTCRLQRNKLLLHGEYTATHFISCPGWGLLEKLEETKKSYNWYRVTFYLDKNLY